MEKQQVTPSTHTWRSRPVDSEVESKNCQRLFPAYKEQKLPNYDYYNLSCLCVCLFLCPVRHLCEFLSPWTCLRGLCIPRLPRSCLARPQPSHPLPVPLPLPLPLPTYHSYSSIELHCKPQYRSICNGDMKRNYIFLCKSLGHFAIVGPKIGILGMSSWLHIQLFARNANLQSELTNSLNKRRR